MMTEMNRNVGILITLAKQYIGRALTRMLIEYGIDEFNGPQGRILHALWHHEKISIQELANHTGLANASLTSMLDRMEQKMLIRRVPSEDDRRKILISLTDKARELEDKYNIVSTKMNELTYRDFSAEEISQFESYLERIVDNVRRIKR